MIAACPKCGARYRVEKERLQPAGARLRCSRCEVVFRVRPPADEAPALPEAPAPPELAAPAPPPGPPVAVALSDPDAAKETVAALERWGFQPTLYADGASALLGIHREPPRVVVLDASLARLGGLQVCEIVKRNPGLRELRVVFVGVLEASELEADVIAPDGFLEAADLPDGLAPLLVDFGLPLRRPPRTEARRAGAAPASGVVGRTTQVGPARAAAAAPGPPADDGLAEQREAALRLARIIVSDIVLYNREKFAAALAAEDVCSAMANELREGRKLFQERIDERVRQERDYLAEELRRAAAARLDA